LHSSGATRGVTVLTLLTLIFAPVFTGHHRHKRVVLATQYTTQQSVACLASQPCPETAASMRGYVLPGKPGPICAVLAQRIEWFSSVLRNDPAEKPTYRGGALAASARAFVAAGCGIAGGPPIVSGVTVSPLSEAGSASGSR
jgi:hypothetical protein